MMPQASVQLVAGMLEAYHPTFPRDILHVMATAGRRLDRIYARPLVPPLDLRMIALRQYVILDDRHLAALRAVMHTGSVTQDVAMSSGQISLFQLMDFGLLESSPFESKRLLLADPVLITMNVVQPAFVTMPMDLEYFGDLLATAEGKVLEFLVRNDLATICIKHMNLAGVCPGLSCM